MDDKQTAGLSVVAEAVTVSGADRPRRRSQNAPQ